MSDYRLRIAILTSRRAYPIIKEEAEKTAISLKEAVAIDVYALPIDIAGFLSADGIAKIILSNKALLEKLRSYDYILIPGNVKGDVEAITKITGAKCFKASSEPGLLLPVIEELLRGGELSTVLPAEEIIRENLLENAYRYLEESWRKTKIAFTIDGLKIPLRSPPFVLVAEIPYSLDVEDAIEYGLRFEEEGADIVVVGGSSPLDEERFLLKIRRLGDELRRAIIGVDVDSPKLIIKSVKEGARLVLTMTPQNYMALSEIKKEAAFVASVFPSNTIDEIEAYTSFLSKAKNTGFENIIVDPLLSTPSHGIINTMNKYSALMERLPDYPFFACYGNYAELADVDPHGVIALLSFMSAELGISVIMVTADSWKTHESVGEAWIALQMASLSIPRKSNPHNVGLDLLLYRSKKPSPRPIIDESIRIVKIPDEKQSPQLDKWGYITVWVDNNNEEITVCLHHYDDKSSDMCYRGKNAENLYKTILRNHSYFSLEHAAYLGYELSKANISLITGKSYVQDRELFEDIRTKIQSYEKLRIIKEKWARGDSNPGPPGYQPGAPPS